jgi:hypothetical protein
MNGNLQHNADSANIMEFSDHFKNGANPKSHTSRDEYDKYLRLWV